MRGTGRIIVSLALAGIAASSLPTAAAPLTADRAVQLALEHNQQVINAEAGVLTSRGGLYQAYASLLPSLQASFDRSGAWREMSRGATFFAGQAWPSPRNDYESFATSPGIAGSWNVVDLSSIAGLRAAQHGMKAAQARREAARQGVVLLARQQFYEVVKAEKFLEVNANALALARDSERRVRALFEVGSVSRSDVLKAQVSTAQAQLDSMAARQGLLVQRNRLATVIGVAEGAMGEVDTVLAVTPVEYRESALLEEAAASRPDLQASATELKAARAALRAANLRRLPSLSVNGGLTYRPRSNVKQTAYELVDRVTGVVTPLDEPLVQTGRSESDLQYQASVSLNLSLFSGFAIEGQIARARAQLVQAENAHATLVRDLAGEVHEAVLTYAQSLAGEQVARTAVESAGESMRLTQQKYNVGSATILDLIDSQVQLQRAQSQLVNALAAIRVAEARIEQVRGRGL